MGRVHIVDKGIADLMEKAADLIDALRLGHIPNHAEARSRMEADARKEAARRRKAKGSRRR